MRRRPRRSLWSFLIASGVETGVSLNTIFISGEGDGDGICRVREDSVTAQTSSSV